MLSSPWRSNSDSGRQIAVFREYYFLWTALALVLAVVMQLPYVGFAFGQGLAVPYGPLWVKEPAVQAAAGLLAAGCLMLLAAGYWRWWVALAALLFAYFYFNNMNFLRSVAFVNRLGRENCLFLALLALFVGRPKAPRENDFFLFALKTAVVFPYFSAGVFKVLHGGADWWSGRALQLGFVNWSISGANPTALWLAENDTLCLALSVATVAAELLAPVVLFSEALGALLVAYAIVFHVVVVLFVGPNFLEFFLPAFVVFLTPWKGLPAPSAAARNAYAWFRGSSGR